MEDPILMPATRMQRLLDALTRDGTLGKVREALHEAAMQDGTPSLSHAELHRAVDAMPASAQRHFEQMEQSLLRDYDRLPMRPVVMLGAGQQVRSVNRMLRAHDLPPLDRGIERQVLSAYGR